MDSQDVAKSMRGSVGMLAMHWLLAPSTTEQAVEAGMPDGIAGYAVGRLGVLGDCPVDNVVAAAFFWDPDFLAKQIVKGRAQFDPKEGAPIYAKICQKWGEDHLKGFDGIERLGELAERVVNNASPLGAPSSSVGVIRHSLNPAQEEQCNSVRPSENLVFLGSAQQCSAQACHHSTRL